MVTKNDLKVIEDLITEAMKDCWSGDKAFTDVGTAYKIDLIICNYLDGFFRDVWKSKKEKEVK